MSDTSETSGLLNEEQLAVPLAEIPARRVSFVFQLVFFFASLASNMILLPVIIFLIPHQVNAFDPAHHVTSLALVQIVGGIFFLLAAPLAGAVSDRSTARLGRRRFWLLIHMLGVSVAIVWLANAGAVWMLVVGWALLQFFGSATLTILQAVIPDQVPVNQRGVVSAFFGLAIPFGAVVGGAVVAIGFKNTPLASYYVFLALLIITILLFVAILREGVLSRDAAGNMTWSKILARFWVNPRKYPDFAWALLTRLLLFLGYYAVGDYLQYYIQDGLHYAQLFPGKTVLQGTLAIQSIMTVLILICTFAAGFISDKMQRRKPAVVVSGLLIALALFIPAISPTWNALLVFAAIFGAGYGGYLAVDTALITQVLPKAEDRGKDLGIINLALAIPLIVSPLLAATLVNTFGYAILFTVAGVLAVLGSVLVWPIKNVR